MPLAEPKSASIAFMKVLLERFPNRFAWFSLSEQETPTWNPYGIPFAASPHLKKPARFPILRLVLNYVFYSRVQAHQAARFARENGCSIVLADLAFEAVIVGRLTAKRLGVPFLVNVHDDPVNRIRVKKYPAWFVNWYEKQFERTLRAAKRVGVISDYMGEAYNQRYGVNTTTLYIGVEQEFCLPPRSFHQSKKPILIGSLGSMNSPENWNLLIDAVKILNHEFGEDSFRILHIGNLIDNLKKNEYVEVTGWLPQDQFLLQLERIDLGFINWSFKPKYSEAGKLSFPLKIHSFIQAQCPLVALGPEESAVVRFVKEHDCGLWCTDFNVDRLVEPVKSLLNKDFYDQATFGMKALITKFSRNLFFYNFEKFIDY